MAYNGTIKNLFPPLNNGTSRGAGMIDGDTGSNLVFQTPGDNNGLVLQVGDAIVYELGSNGQISSIQSAADDIPHR